MERTLRAEKEAIFPKGSEFVASAPALLEAATTLRSTSEGFDTLRVAEVDKIGEAVLLLSFVMAEDVNKDDDDDNEAGINDNDGDDAADEIRDDTNV